MTHASFWGTCTGRKCGEAYAGFGNCDFYNAEVKTQLRVSEKCDKRRETFARIAPENVREEVVMVRRDRRNA